MESFLFLTKDIMKREKIIVLIIVLIAISVVIADLILFCTSMQETGVGSGFSRYWRNVQID